MRRKDGKGRFIALVNDKTSDEIARFANSGMSYQSIGKKFGLTAGQIKAHLWYRRMTYEEKSRGQFAWPEDELTTALWLKRCGISTAQIGQLLGRSKRSVIGATWRAQRGKRSKATD